tara:strand:+ start:302 stop:634 length:333 start_codon:yes stop_codon:yes gene_type:complete
MNILKHLFSCIVLLFFITSGVYAGDSDKKKCHGKNVKKCHEKMWGKKGMWKQRPIHKMFGDPMMGMGGPFAMIEAQGRLFLYNKKSGDVWVCNAFKKTCEQLVIENKDID